MAGATWFAVQAHALTEPRIRRIARRMNLSEFDVLGRFNHLWMLTLTRQSEMVDAGDAEMATGELPGFLAMAIEERMIDRVDDKTLRVRGAEEAIGRLIRDHQQRSAAGRASGERRRQASAPLPNRTGVQLSFNERANSRRTPTNQPTNQQDPITFGDLVPNSQSTSGLTNSVPDLATGPTSVQNVGPAELSEDDSKTPHSSNGEHVEPVGWDPSDLQPEAWDLAGVLMHNVMENSPGHRLHKAAPRLVSKTQVNWAADIEKLHRIDKIPYEVIRNLIQWVQRSPFWRGVILSGESLRENYDKIRVQIDNRRVERQQPRPGPSELAAREVQELERRLGSK